MNSVFEFFKSTILLTRLWQNGRRGVLQLVTLLLLLCCLQPAFATPTTPTSDFIDNKNGTVTHKTTGLTWMRCAMGQTWTGSSCSGSASTYTYDQAVALTRTFAGHSDWRLPNIAELQTIVERENINPAINTTMFPNTLSNWFWSSSPKVSYTNNAWYVNFNDGYVRSYNRSHSFAVRLVRASQSLGIDPSTPNADFADNQDGTVTHKRTGLMWQRCSVGQIWTGATCSGTASTYQYNTALALTSSFAGHNDWRVPNANELASIVKYNAANPSINQDQFPNIPNGFWSSSPYVGFTNYAWSVHFNNGYVDYYHYYSFAVRLVRVSHLDIGPDVVLLLHGMNSEPAIWNSVASSYFANNCPIIYNGKISQTAKPNPQNAYCYRVKFGAFDAGSPDKGLEDAWAYGNSIQKLSAGDYSTFDQLGSEVNKAINAIKVIFPNAKILLLGHSRGGLAARAFLQNPLFSVNKKSVGGLITTGTPHNGTRLGRVYKYIKQFLLKPDGTRFTEGSFSDDWQTVDFLSGKISCLGQQNFNIDVRRPVIGYLADNGLMIKNLNGNTANLPAIKYGELVYNGVRLGQLATILNGLFAYNLFDEPDYADICYQVSRQAEAFIKGGTFAAPTPSSNYPGDGIVTAGSQGATVFPTVKKLTYKSAVLHTEEPKQTAHIANMTCKLGFSWLKSCAATAQAPVTKQAQAPFAVSHDYDDLVALTTGQLWQDWLAIITDDAQANQREQFAVALGIKLRASDNAGFYADSEQRLLNANAPPLERARLAGLLAEIATPSAFGLLADALLNPACLAIQTALSNAILSVADSLPEQPRRADLSAVLENAWTRPKQNQQQLNTLAVALAKLGTPRGVELLLTAVDKTGATLPSAKKKQLSYAEKQAKAAFMAMDEIINPDSETVLGAAFMSHHANEAVFIAAGNGLVNLGRDEAAQRVLQRLNELPDNAVPVGQQWLSRLSGKIEKTALRSMNKAVGMPRQRVLRQQMEEMVQ